MEFPRRKNFIKNLNILLSGNPISTPDKTFTFRTSTSHNSRTDLQRRNSHNLINAQRVATANPMKRKINNISEHFRSISSARNLEAEKRMGQSLNMAKREKMKSMLSVQNIRKQLSSSRKASTSQTYRMNKERAANPEYDLRMVSSVQMTRTAKDPSLTKF